jgi:hypothetical protein
LRNKVRRGCPAPVYAKGFDGLSISGAPKLLSEGGKAGHDEFVGARADNATAFVTK